MGTVLRRIPGGVIRVLLLVGLGVAVPGASTAQDVDLDEIGYELGSPEAKVTVVELGGLRLLGLCAFPRDHLARRPAGIRPDGPREVETRSLPFWASPR